MARHIEDYALIGDLRTAGLVGVDGAIDWLLLPRFDSPAVFAALLGHADHGRWSLAPVEPSHSGKRQYRPETLILETDWTTADGAVRVTDFMVPGSSTPVVVRIVDGLVGSVTMRTQFVPRMTYGRDVPLWRRSVDGRLIAASGEDELWLDGDVALRAADGSSTADFVIGAGERITFTLTYAATDVASRVVPDVALADTEAFWTEWVGRSTYAGPWVEEVNQSLIVLKALTYAPTGSIVAAATTSLPEQIGGSRNWDYRYAWLRDATFTLYAFIGAGFLEEAEAWRDWLVRSVIDSPSDPQIMYAIDGAEHVPEQTLDWLPGYEGSSPVRVGNAAAIQHQNDVWGEVLDILLAVREAGIPATAEQEKIEHALLDQIERHWQEPDHGLWEVRGPCRHFVHSKVLAWVGVDRAIRIRSLAHQGTDESRELERLEAMRRTIALEICDRGYHSGRQAYTQSYGSPKLDAAVLLMPRYGFTSWDDPHMVATVNTIQRCLTDQGLVQRYLVSDDGNNVDGVPGGEGTFLAASFWLVDALHGIGRTDEAVEMFERLLSLRNDVGLLSEEYDPTTGRHLGNTPQAFSHASVVTTALTLSAAADSGRGSSAAPAEPFTDVA
ncbi:glycoside hydrolase family 15 protein [Kribbella shirazensis]|uniref:GH15 family glucan-1,4-alpha-glucosidase n=1 Tax=Kribbella shirazensis TaxID=1105143 RepID=A0A7X5VJQ1_9ACTN|nr:glycoside hydrolase family 15 protein [Kribbella shirazensis]NIK61358.1 GH15 family glucan-1,4-alpha-glucosidase [Kribbella shirazensis]